MAKNLWKFEPREKPGAEPLRPADVAEARSNSQSVGVTLRERREERGEDLRYVAQVLRIRYPYLKAIEDGEIDDLPGPTYAIGFVRTYAEHLGLDAKDMVVRFKAEVEGLQARNDLNFPAPIPEGKIPSGAILLVGIVIAALVYAIWIYVSSKDQAVSRMATPAAVSVAGASDLGPAADPPLRRSEGAVAKTEPLKSPSATGAKPDADAGSVEPAGKPPVVAADEPKQQAEIAATPASEAPQPEPAADQKKTEAATPPPVPPARETAPAEATSVAPVASAVEASGSVPGEGGKVYGQGNANARIVLHAIADSWVEVRDKASDELLLTRVLFKGDRFRVPDRPGLTLLTGNAGGLRITVDGEDVPPIGSVGSVRRDVALDPAQLKTGARRVKNPNQAAATGASTGTGR